MTYDEILAGPAREARRRLARALVAASDRIAEHLTNQEKEEEDQNENTTRMMLEQTITFLQRDQPVDIEDRSDDEDIEEGYAALVLMLGVSEANLR